MSEESQSPTSGGHETRRVVFRGRVQGVGFRFTTCRIASGFPVTGYVKNLPDGSVELVSRGHSDDLTAFIDEICRVMQGNVSDFDSLLHPREEEFVDFSIRY